jgi:hypothetical protein
MRAVILAFLAGLLGVAPARAGEAPLVVVELFTSQGCSSCPPADSYLGELARRPDVLALAFHVDYWNYIGWTDPFASKLASQRQREYARHLNLRYVYTPQMVINGASEGVGSERGVIGTLIKAATDEKAQHQPVMLVRNPGGKLTVHIDAGQTKEPATVWLIGYDTEHTTQVLRGENGGQTLTDYQIVRNCESLGTWRGEAMDIAVDPSQAAGTDGIAVLLQLGGGGGRVIGAATLKPMS